jgi:hypothetical protein
MPKRQSNRDWNKNLIQNGESNCEATSFILKNVTQLSSSIIQKETSPYSSIFTSLHLNSSSSYSDLLELISSNDESSSVPNSPTRLESFEN